MRPARSGVRGSAHAAHLVVADVIVALVRAPSVRAGLERCGDVLDVRDVVHDDFCWPAGLPLRDRVEVDYRRRRVSQNGMC